jgi:hypothetical protein
LSLRFSLDTIFGNHGAPVKLKAAHGFDEPWDFERELQAA